jgi:hypothetical protein
MKAIIKVRLRKVNGMDGTRTSPLASNVSTPGATHKEYVLSGPFNYLSAVSM